MHKLTGIIQQDASDIVSSLDLYRLENKVVSVAGATGIIGTYMLAVLSTFGRCRAVYPVASKQPEEGHPALAFAANLGSWTYSDLANPASQAIIPSADFIVYAAGYGQPAKFMANPLETIKLNTEGLCSAFRSLRQDGRLLYTSSSEIYSGSHEVPYTESNHGATTPQHPRGCYIEAKRCGEAICHCHNIDQLSAISARIALSYGPGTKKYDDRVLNQFIRQALVEGEIRLRDAGNSVRTYCYIADCVKQLLNVGLSGSKEVYNIGGISRLTILELAKMVGDYCGVPVLVPNTVSMLDSGAPAVVEMDLSRFNKEFGKPDYTPMRIGVARTIEWQKQLYSV